METVEILAITLISLTIIKFFLLGTTKESWQRFTNMYAKSMTENHWLYFTIYFSISLFCLYLIRTTSLLTLYILVWFFIMYQSIKEIFNF